MSINYNPKIVTDGLLTCLDAGNTKSFDPYENLFTYSETFTSPSLWSLLDCAASKNAVDPNGVNNSATTITRNSTAYGGLYVYQPSNGFSVTSGVAYTFSIFLKAGTASSITVSLENSGTGGAVFSYSGITVNLATGTITSGSGGTIVAYPNGWYRVSITETATATGTAEPGIYSSGTTAFPLNGTMFIWGAQFERASSASRYYATTGTSKSRGTNLVDISGNSKNGTLTNGPTYSAFNSGNFSLDGTDDHIIINHQLFPLSAFTFDLWFKPSNNDTLKIFWMNEMQIFFQTVSKNIYRRWYNNNATAIAFQESFTPNYASLWTNVCWTIGNLIDIVYINGSQVGPNRNTTISSPAITGFNGQTTSGIFIGRDEEAIYRAFDVASVKVYNRALTAAEIQQNFNALRGRFGV